MIQILKKVFFACLGVAALSVALTSCYDKFDSESYAPPLNIGGFTSSNEVAAGNLVAYWSFNGTLLDSISNTSGTNVGTTYSNGIKGQAIQGSNNAYVLFDPTPAILGLQSFTISQWVNTPLNEDGIVGLVNLSNTSRFWGNINIFIENGSTQTAARVKAIITNGDRETDILVEGLAGVFGTWTNITVSYDATSETLKFYANGNLQGTKQVAGYGPLQFTNSGPMVFGTVHFMTDPSLTTGSGHQDWAGYLIGQLDEVRIYNKALTDEEVSSLVRLEGRGK